MATALLPVPRYQPFIHFDDSLPALMDNPAGHSQGVTLQPVFIPRQHSGLSRDASMQQQGSMNSNSLAAAASADWAYLLRNAAALRNGSMTGSDAAQLAAQLAASSSQLDMHGRATSPQFMSSPGNFLVTSAPLQAMQQQQNAGASHSASGLFGSNSMAGLDALTQLSADALASATGDPSNSFTMMPNGNLTPTLSGMSSMHADGTVQTLYGSNDAAVAAAAAAAAARATATQSILHQQAAAAAVAANNANLGNSLGHAGLANLGNSLNLNSLMQLEESLSGTLFGPGGAAAAASPKPVSASLYIKVG